MKSGTLLLALALGLVGATISYAQGPAIVVENGLCTLFARDGFGGFVTFPGTTSQAVDANSKKNTRKFSCHGTAPEWVRPSSAENLNYANTGFLCDVDAEAGEVLTTRWKEVVTPDGAVNLTCHLRDD